MDSDESQLENSSAGQYSSFFDKNKVSIAIFLIGLIFIGIGVFMYRQGLLGSGDKIEIISSSDSVSETPDSKKQIVVEISGSVEKPGVYTLSEGVRVEDLLIAAGGISVEADRVWVEKFINRAAKLIDGQKLYIPKLGEQSDSASANNDGGVKLDQGVLGANSSGMVNINTASLSELDSLPGIGQVYGQSIIEHRPYSSIDELVSRGAIKQSVFDKIKDKITVY